MAEADLDDSLQHSGHGENDGAHNISSVDLTFASIEPSSFIAPSINGTPQSDGKTSTGGPPTPHDTDNTNISTTNGNQRLMTTDFPIPDTPAPLKAAIDDMSKLMYNIEDLARGDDDDTIASMGPISTVGGFSPRTNASSVRKSSGSMNTGSLTLKEQEKVINEVKKENFSLKLKIYHLEERLQLMAPDHIESALKENIELKVQFQTLARQLKNYKRLLEKQDRAMELLHAERAKQLSGSVESQQKDAELAHLRELVRQKDAEMENLRANALTLTIKVQQNDAEMEKIRATVSTLTTEVKQKDSEMETMRVNVTELNAEARQKDAELEDVYRQIDDKDAEIAEKIEEQARTASRSPDPLLNEFGEDAISSLRDKVSELTLEVSQRDTELSTLRERISALIGESQQKDAEIDDVYRQLDDKEAQLADEVEAATAPLAQEADRLLEENELLKEDLQTIQQELDAEIASLRDKISALRVEVLQKDAEIEDVYRQIDDKEAQLVEEIEAATAPLAQEADRLHEENELLKEDLQEFQQDQDALVKKVEELEAMREQDQQDQDAELSTLRDRISALIVESQQKDAKIDNVYRQLDDKKAQLVNEVKAATAPLAQKADHVLKENELLKKDVQKIQQEQDARIASLREDLRNADDDANKSAVFNEEVVNDLKKQLLLARSRLIELPTQHDRIIKDLKERHATVQSHYDTLSAQHDAVVGDLKDKLAATQNRLGSVSGQRERDLHDLGASFEKRAKELETRYGDQYKDLRKQLDIRLRQLDKFEGVVKSASVVQRTWREKLMVRTGELEAAKNLNSKLHEELDNHRRKMDDSIDGSPSRAVLKALETKATSSEKREKAASKRLLDAESRWMARLKELETRLRAAEERVKRERQGAKERVGDLENNIKDLEKQLEGAKRRNVQLGVYVKDVK